MPCDINARCMCAVLAPLVAHLIYQLVVENSGLGLCPDEGTGTAT